MSMYGLTASLIPLLRNAAFGVRIKTPTAYNPETGEPTEFEWKDTAVQELADMLLDALANTDPIPLAAQIKLDASRIQGPPIVIIGPPGPPGEPGPPGPPGDPSEGQTGDVQVVVGVSISVSINACTVTVTPTISYKTLHFTGGLLTGVS